MNRFKKILISLGVGFIAYLLLGICVSGIIDDNVKSECANFNTTEMSFINEDHTYVYSNNLLGQYTFNTTDSSARISSQNVIRIYNDNASINNYVYEISFNIDDLMIIDSNYAFLCHQIFRADNDIYISDIGLNGVGIISDVETDGIYAFASFSRSQLINGNNTIRIYFNGWADNDDNFIGFGIYDTHNLNAYEYRISSYNYFEPYFEPIPLNQYNVGYDDGYSSGYSEGISQGILQANKTMLDNIYVVETSYASISKADLINNTWLFDTTLKLWDIANYQNTYFSSNHVWLQFNDPQNIEGVKFSFLDGFNGSITIDFDYESKTFSNLSIDKFVLTDYLDDIEYTEIVGIIFDIISPDAISNIIMNTDYYVGFNQGFNNGNAVGKYNGILEGKEIGYNNGYAVGYNEGYNVGIVHTEFSFNDLMFAIPDTFANSFNTILDFEIFGFNFRSFIAFVLLTSIVIWCMRKFKE